MRSVLFVCTANLCRSPMAEAVFRRMLGRHGMEREFIVSSAGTHAYHVGKPPAPHAVIAAGRRGYDISRYVAKRLSMEDFDRYDHILAMDLSHIAHLNKVAPTRAKERIELLLEYGGRFHETEVPDPYGHELEQFERALDMIEDGCSGLAHVLREHAWLS